MRIFPIILFFSQTRVKAGILKNSSFTQVTYYNLSFPENPSQSKKSWFYSLLNENSCTAALRDGNQEANNAIMKTVTVTNKKSTNLSLTGK